ncbi:MAG: hypothetical protein MUE74_08000 [Bacteroidales bacterium]|nr:hypothetical protein [Bacteroidales bacterium]
MQRKGGQGGGNPGSKGLKGINRNILVFLLFLLLSFVFWYLNSLSKEIDTSLRYPVRYTNKPSGYSTFSNLPARLTVMLKGPGYSILRLKLSAKKHPFEIDLSQASLRHDQDKGPNAWYLITAPLITGFNTGIIQGCKVVSVKPDTVFFSFRK